MTNKRTSIRKAIVAAIDGTSELAGRVTSSRVRRVQREEMPCAAVYALKEPAEMLALGKQRRVVAIVVEVRATATDDLDDALDALCEVVEAAIFADPKHGGLAVGTQLATTEIGLDGEGDERQGVAQITFDVTYLTPPGSPAG